MCQLSSYQNIKQDIQNTFQIYISDLNLKMKL